MPLSLHFDGSVGAALKILGVSGNPRSCNVAVSDQIGSIANNNCLKKWIVPVDESMSVIFQNGLCSKHNQIRLFPIFVSCMIQKEILVLREVYHENCSSINVLLVMLSHSGFLLAQQLYAYPTQRSI